MFFSVEKSSAAKSRKRTATSCTSQIEDFFGGQTIHSIYTFPIYTRHPLEFPSWKLSVRAALDDVTQTSMPKWMVQRHLSRSDKKSTDQNFLRRLYDTYVSYKWCVYTIITFISILYLCYTCILLCMCSIYSIMGYKMMTQLGPDRSSDGLPLIKQPRGCPAGRPGAGCWERSTFQMFFKWLLRWIIFSFFLTSGSLGSLDVDLMKKKSKSL